MKQNIDIVKYINDLNRIKKPKKEEKDFKDIRFDVRELDNKKLRFPFNILNKFIFKKDLIKCDAFVLYTDKSKNLIIYEIDDIKISDTVTDKNAKYFFDKAIFKFQGRPMFWIYNDIMITVDNLKTENENFVAVFSPESWYNIEENVVTAKLTGVSGGLSNIGDFIKKYWKAIVLVVIVLIGYLAQSGQINIK